MDTLGAAFENLPFMLTQERLFEKLTLHSQGGYICQQKLVKPQKVMVFVSDAVQHSTHTKIVQTASKFPQIKKLDQGGETMLRHIVSVEGPIQLTE